MENHIKLKGSWEHSAHTIEVFPDGSLVAEIYDFSGNRGGDEAWGIKVSSENQLQLLTCLKQEPLFQARPFRGSPLDQLQMLLPLLVERFNDYDDFKSWVQDRGIPFAEFRDWMA